MALIQFAGSERLSENNIVSAKQLKYEALAEGAAMRAQGKSRYNRLFHNMAGAPNQFGHKKILMAKPEPITVYSCVSCSDTGRVTQINGVSVAPIRCECCRL